MDSIPMNSLSNQSNQEHNSSLIDSDENDSLDIRIKTMNEVEFLQDMEAKLSKLKDFMDSLGQLKDSEISKQIFEHFQKESEQFTQMNSKTIIAETLKRIQKMKKSRKVKKNWSSNDMKVLIWVICKYAEKQSINLSEVQCHDDFWKFVSSVIPGTTPESCLFKWLSQRRYKITLHSWKQSEEKLLMELQKKHSNANNKWKIISEKLYLLNSDNQKIFRHPKQCREHYASFLDPTIVKGPWSMQQDTSLLSYIIFNNGQKKWCKLTKVLQGRTQNAIKNRYQLLFSKLKKKKQNKNRNEFQIVLQYLKENDAEFEMKRQLQAAKNPQMEKNSVGLDQPQTLQSIHSAKSLPLLPVGQQLIGQKQVKIIIPVVRQFPSNFKILDGNQQGLQSLRMLTASHSSTDIAFKQQEK